MGYKNMDYIRQMVEQLPIEQVIGAEINLPDHGAERKALCPFHNDHSIGSFGVNTRKNIWKCYSCGAGGVGAISFYKKLHGVIEEEAVLEIAVKHGIEIPNGEEIKARSAVRPKPSKITMAKPVGNQKLSPDALDAVYRTFIAAAGSLPEEMEKRLRDERKLSDGQMRDFFILPTYSKQFMKNFMIDLKKQGMEPEKVLAHTPGFYYNNFRDEWCFSKRNAGALGIIAHDECGRVNGIQLRRDTDDHKKRYIWFSTGFADEADGFSDGTSLGTIVDVVQGRKKKALFCTEGKFKALKLVEHFGYTALNMHGVSSWPANYVIRYAQTHGVKKIYLCYDSDFLSNEAVAKAAGKFVEALLKFDMTVEFIVWDSIYGKGIDDMLNAGHADKLQRLDGKWVLLNKITPFLMQKSSHK